MLSTMFAYLLTSVIHCGLFRFFQPLPLTQLVPGGMHPNKMIYISGVPHPQAKRSVLGVEAVGGRGMGGGVHLHPSVFV